MTAPVGIAISIQRIDLPKAERLLSFFKEQQKGVKGTNRKWSPGVVNDYAFEMLAGRWGFSHEGFAFHGRLGDGTAEGQDGEQRLRALIQACTVGAVKGEEGYEADPNFSFDVTVTEGLPKEAIKVMNIGKRRTSSDFLAMEGEINVNALSSALALCHAYEIEPEGAPFLRDRWAKAMTMSPIMRQEYLDNNPGIRAAIMEGARLHRHLILASAASGYYLALKAGVKQESLDEFMESMFSGTGPNWNKDNPILRLREMLSNARAGKRVVSREEQLALFIKALNAFLAGRTIKRNLMFRTKKVVITRHGKEVEISAESFPRFEVPKN